LSKPRDKRNIALKPIQLRNDDAALCPPGRRQGRRELRATIERISALPGLELGMLFNDGQRLGRDKALDGCPLRLDPKPSVSPRGRLILELR
jgi:hypothetical protein